MPEKEPPLTLSIYTDGSCKVNPGSGGYAAILRSSDERERKVAGGYRHTTNNRMELMAVIEGLKTVAVDKYDDIALYSDSKYVVEAFNQNWVDKWIGNGWRKSKSEPLPNADLWRELVPLVRKLPIRLLWVRGHSNNEGNNATDALANEHARKNGNPPDEVYEEEHGGPPENPPQTEPTQKLTHVDGSGAVKMVGVGDKPLTKRRAVAKAQIVMNATTLDLIRANKIAKGDVLATARIAAINAAKRTDEMIPLCHQIPLDKVAVDFNYASQNGGLAITVEAQANWKTGVEMEALLAASVAALTIYDMCKAVDKTMRVTELYLATKEKTDNTATTS